MIVIENICHIFENHPGPPEFWYVFRVLFAEWGKINDKLQYENEKNFRGQIFHFFLQIF